MSGRDILLPYTAFHIASAIRSVVAGAWSPRDPIVLIGAGSTGTISGHKYTDLLRCFFEQRGLGYELRQMKLASLLQARAAIGSSGRLVTGNLRRTQSLLIAARAREIVLIDDGVGTTVENGYFSPNWAERSRLRRAAIRLGLLPPYANMLSKISSHPTVYDYSIYPNYKSIPFIPASRDNLPAAPARSQTIFVTSFLRAEEIDRYASWAKTSFRIPPGTLVSLHPNLPLDRAKLLTDKLGLTALDTDGLLLEEYIFHRSADGCEIDILGQENSSTLIARNLENVRINCRAFPATAA